MGVTQIPFEEICRMTPFENLVLDEATRLRESFMDNKVIYAMLVEKRK